MPAPLKVFITSDGLTEYVVAASSRPKALAAWGVHQDLFKTGAAHQTDDPALTEAARASPGEVLRRPLDTKAALAKLPKPSKPKAPSKALLRKIADLKAKLAAADAAHQTELQQIEAARADLDLRARRAEDRHRADRKRLEAALANALATQY